MVRITVEFWGALILVEVNVWFWFILSVVRIRVKFWESFSLRHGSRLGLGLCLGLITIRVTLVLGEGQGSV